jgi:hypothetical protein
VRASLAASLLAALALAAPAGAHVIASPSFLSSGSTETIELSAPNERDAPMTSFAVTVPPGLEIVSAEETEGWTGSVDGQTATWAGASLPAKLSATFGLRVEATGEPGSVELATEQRYADGEVRWPVALTIVPGDEPEDAGGSALVVGVIVGIGVLVTAAVGVLAWRRRSGSLQER